MNPDKPTPYTVKWIQPYTAWRVQAEQAEALMETMLELTEYKEAKEVIERIKKL